MKPKYYFLIVFLFLFAITGNAQNQISGTVLDKNSNEPLAFVNILFNEGNQGISTDIDGHYTLPHANIKSLTFRYVGYEPLTLTIEEVQKRKVILLRTKMFGLEEVIIRPGENPAHRIINLAIANKKINNPELSTSFFYESYNKLVFTCLIDSSLSTHPDSVAKMDTSTQEMMSFFDKQHVFIMESVSERNHIPPEFSKEEIVASRVSGLKNPMFSLIGTQLQSFSLYKNYIELFGEIYLSPISAGSTTKYLFDLRDTLYDRQDTIFRIYFQPQSGKNFDGLKGFLSINTNKYAVQNFIAEPFESSDFHVKIRQNYEFIESKQWFPIQLNTLIYFKNIEVNDCEVVGIGRSYLSDISLDAKLEKREIGNTILKMSTNAGKKDEAFWNSKRQNPLDAKEMRTYHFIDSIGEEENLDRKLAILPTLLRGAIPFKFVDIPLKHLMTINGYEGFRLGLGVESNEKFLPWFRLGAYGAYGFKDKAWKQGYYTRFLPFEKSEFELKTSYSRDVAQSGGVYFNNEVINGFNPESIRRFYVDKMDSVEEFRVDLSFRAMRDFQFNLFSSTQNRVITNSYVFRNESNEGELLSQYRVVETGIETRYAFREKYVEMFDVKQPLPNKYPVFFVKLTKGLDNVLEGDLDYLKIDLKLDQRFTIKNLGKTMLRFTAGAVDNPIPIGLLYRTRGTYNDRYRISSLFSFETALPNEFYADRYFNAFFRHSFESLLMKTNWFQPEISIVSAFAIGDIGAINQHQNFEFSTPNLGFFESGLELTNLADWLSLGVGVYYRYGAYANEEWKDNLVFKLSSSLNF